MSDKGLLEKIIEVIEKFLKPIRNAFEDEEGFGLHDLIMRATNLEIFINNQNEDDDLLSGSSSEELSYIRNKENEIYSKPTLEELVNIQSEDDDLFTEDPSISTIMNIMTSIIDEYNIISSFLVEDEDENENKPTPKDTFNSVIKIINSFEELKNIVIQDNAIELAKLIFDYLLITYLYDYKKKIYWFFVLLGIIVERDIFNGKPATIDYNKIKDFFLNPLDFKSNFSTIYGQFKPYRFLSHLQRLFLSFNIPATFYNENGYPKESERALYIPLLTYNSEENDQSTTSEIGFKILPLTKTSNLNNDAGLAVIPFGIIEGSKTIIFDNLWNLILDLYGEIETYGLNIRPDSINVKDGGSAIHLSAVLKRILPGNVPMFTLGNPDGTRFELGSIGAKLQLDHENDFEFSIGFPLQDCRIVIQSSDGDGLIQKILPKKPIFINFPLIPMFSTKKGFYIEGGAGFSHTFLINKSFGPLFINSLDFNLNFNLEKSHPLLELISRVTGSVEIGPLSLIVGKMGFSSQLEFGKPGIFGKADLSFRYLPPKSIGIALKTETISGVGFLHRDPPNYAGMLNLSVKDKFAITATGILTTKLPDNKPGYSLLLSLTAEFATPIQLGYGFALNGVGGIIGFNRRMMKQALIDAQKTHSLDHVLFPKDIIKNAVSIINTLQNIFPPEDGYYVFGPMVKLFWGGAYELVKFNVGIFIEFGGPGLVALIGLAHVALPKPEKPVIVLNMDVLGIIDFGDKTLSIDSSLFNSRLLDKFTLSGDMALRSNWGDDPDFVLSIGGFHPRFSPPPGFPRLKRLMISLGSGNPRISIQMYLAFTTNTFQTGALLDIYYKKSKFRLTGKMGFDALVKFKPLSFEVDINGRATIKAYGKTLLTTSLRVTLTGPNPYRIRGYAKFKALWAKVKIKFDKTFGKKVAEDLPVISPLKMLKSALETTKPIYKLPSWANIGVVLSEEGESFLSPLGNVSITQNAVPLDLRIDKFGGGKPPAGEEYLQLELPDSNGQEMFEEVIPAPSSKFAPAQFKIMSDGEKISAPAFESFTSGVGIRGTGKIPTISEIKEIKFETILISEENQSTKANEKIPIANILGKFEDPRIMKAWTLHGSEKYHKPTKRLINQNNSNYIQVKDPSYTVTSSELTDGRFSRAEINDQDCSDMNYFQARDHVNSLKSSSFDVKNTIFADKIKDLGGIGDIK